LILTRVRLCSFSIAALRFAQIRREKIDYVAFILDIIRTVFPDAGSIGSLPLSPKLFPFASELFAGLAFKASMVLKVESDIQCRISVGERLGLSETYLAGLVRFRAALAPGKICRD
jgi:hypothetical protein